MLFPIIRVKDNHTGYEHIVGTDSHDMLIAENGKITYYNLQNGDGSGEGGSYEFLGNEDEYFGVTIEFVTFEKLKDIYEQRVKEAEERERNLKYIMARVINDAFEEE